METPVARSRGRPRKRRREDTEVVENVNNGDKGDEQDVGVNKNVEEGLQNSGNPRKRGRPPKKRIEIKGEAMVGRYVLKEFEGSGVFLGKIISYDSGLYRVDYEDGDFEDLDSVELRLCLIDNEREKFVGDLLGRKGRLDEMVVKKTNVKKKDGPKMKDEPKEEVEPKKKDEPLERDGVSTTDKLETESDAKLVDRVDEICMGSVHIVAMKVEVPTIPDHSDEDVHVGLVAGGAVHDGDDEDGDDDGVDDDDDDDVLSSDSCEYGQGWENRAETEIPSIPPPELPPSSGNIGVPEEYVSNLFSVYGFLRSFSVRLFLSPFTLDDFVGCLKCTVHNTLLDSIHVAVLRALRRHLESLSSDGSELASKCMRCIDWGLLDIYTWPVYLVHYLMVMGHLDGDEWKGFYTDVLGKDYCTLPVGTKLTVLQILCDDALDTEEIRAEMDMREESEVGVDSDGTTSTVEDGLRKLNPRYCRSSLGKDRGNTNLDADNGEEDGNGDECRLCGMEGMLLCCDGCPSAYHSRCIGVNKLSVPEGEWFCPECTISRLGPAITVGTSLKGAEVFGVDSYAQLFLATCNHLLVLKVSVKASSFVKYYNRSDVPKVVLALCSSPHHAVSYLGICQAILNYWEYPQSILHPFIISQETAALLNRDDDVVPCNQLHLPENGGHKVVEKVELENCAHSVGERFVDNGSGSSTGQCGLKHSSGDVSLGNPLQTDTTGILNIHGAKMNQNPTEVTSKLSLLSEQGLADRSIIAGNASCSSVNSVSSAAVYKNGVCVPVNGCMPGKRAANGVGRADEKWKDIRLYMGRHFKPLAYINQYVHGDFAASAAANFAVLSSDENRASDVHALDPRKAMAANIARQTKAFSSVAVRFFWPSTEKKLMEIPRERCSWCLHCMAPVTSKKACLLNHAALNATRVAMKFFSGLRLVKNIEGALYGIAAYILYMEESLRGLILGPFQIASYREQWRKRVEQVSTCSDMKAILLELEENLSPVAISSEWTKLVDNWMDESSVPQSAGPTGSVQKRGPGRRRKHITVPDTNAENSNDSMSDFIWWRGGKMAKLVFQRGTLPCSFLKKAARQGGKRRMPGIYYADDSNVPKRSRQFIWRAAVEMARNTSRLALQVRYLDNHIRWSDLLRPEQSLQDAKGPETDAAAFRNARICDKRIAENKTIYGVAFVSQKHLSTRLMKSIIDKEPLDGTEKYWFPEARIPLYLIKEYEENAEKTDVPLSKKPDRFTKHQLKQLRAARKNIFCYLSRRRECLDMCLCASCHRDVLLNDAVMCSTCEGFCHKSCMAKATVQKNEDTEYITACKQCLFGKAVTQSSCRAESPTSPLVMQGQEYRNSNSAPVAKSVKLRITGQQPNNSASAAKVARPKVASQQLPSTPESLPDKKPVHTDSNLNKNRKRPTHWGLIWKKKDAAEDGSEFRLKNILYRGDPNAVDTKSIQCHLCHRPYNQNLMYIHCGTCKHWYHADALALDESKLSNLIGFKCCRCRRIKSPVCPYADASLKKTEVKKLRVRGPKEEAAVTSSVSDAVSEQAESVPSTPISPMEEDVYIEVDPLLMPVSEAEQMPEAKTEAEAEADFDWNTSVGPVPQKLPVRRHIKSEKDVEAFGWTDPSLIQLPASVETESVAGWDVPNGGVEDGATYDYDNFNYDATDYEPQTYFSFTELLEADDCNQPEGVDVSAGAWENLPCENSRTGFIEQYEVRSLDPSVGMKCEVCGDPSPDLSCPNCGMRIHSQCSPWEEFPQRENWSCGNCREWR